MSLILKLLCLVMLLINSAYAEETLRAAVTKPIPIDNLANYENYPPVVKGLIREALSLTQQNLTYRYGSNDPKNGGMDCSGTINYLLRNAKLTDVPRDSINLYRWVWQKGKFYAVNSHHFNSFEFSKLKPGDLLFWVGTYNVDRDPPVSHVMLYLGKDKQGNRLMFGADDGRTYLNEPMWGVSVYDFKLPDANSTGRFIGYSCIPGLTCKDF